MRQKIGKKRKKKNERMKIKIERRNGNGGNKMNGNIIKKEDFERELGEEKKEEKK